MKKSKYLARTLCLTFNSGLLTLLISTGAWAAQVQKISKKNHSVLIDDGRKAGFKKGELICFYGGKTEKERKIACGKITKIAKDKAVVQVSPKRLRRIKKNMVARKPAALQENAGASPSSINIRPLYLYSIQTPASFEKILYKKPSNQTGSATANSSLWETTGSAQDSSLGFGLELEVPVSTMSLALGARSRSYSKFEGFADYTENNSALYVETILDGSSIGFWFDLYYARWTISPSTSLRLGVGLDFDISTVKYTHIQRSDTDAQEQNNLLSGSSSLSVISLRFPAALDLYLDPIGLTLGLNLLAPVSETLTSNPEIADPQSSFVGETDAAVEDYHSSLSHKKTAFGAEVLLGSYFSF